MRARVASVAVLTALALGLGACGGSRVKSTVDPVAVAAEKTKAAKTVRYSFTLDEQMSALPAPVKITAEGAMDFEHNRVSMSMDMSQMAALTGTALGSPSDWKVEEIMDGLVIYMKAPFLKTYLKSSKPWIRMDMKSMGEQLGVDLSSGMGYDASQLTNFVDYLRGSKDARIAGHDEIDGVRTTHYQGSLDFDAYLDSLPADQREAARKALENVGGAGKLGPGLFDVWIDGQERIRREKVSSDLSTAAGDMKIDLSMDFFDYDKPLSITVPPADQTVDMTELAGSLGG